MKRTSLYEKHKSLGAKMVPFGGYEMPIQYTSIIDEHYTVRSSVGVFDVSHMGEFEISGRDSQKFLQKMTINDVTKLTYGKAQYTALCNENGGIIDDCILYHRGERYMLVVNASNLEEDYKWVTIHLDGDVKIANRSDDIGLLAIQGPYSREVLKKVFGDIPELRNLQFYRFTELLWKNEKILLSRTGYTGELGYEIYTSPSAVNEIWDCFFNLENEYKILPVGLGARDLLRLEMNYCLYGNDIDETRNPIEAGLSWITKINKGDFIGRTNILKALEKGIQEKLIAFVMDDKGIPRPHYNILSNGKHIGIVTSGGFSPSLGNGIGMGYVDVGYSQSNTAIGIEIRGLIFPATIKEPPLWKNGSLKG